MSQVSITCESTGSNETRCRMCLQNKGLPFGLFDTPNAKNLKGLTYWDILNKICTIKTVNEGDIPQKICMLCARDVKKCYSFISLCENSDKILQEEMSFVDLTKEVTDLINVSKNTEIEDENTFNIIKIDTLAANRNSVIIEMNENSDTTDDNLENENVEIIKQNFESGSEEIIDNSFDNTDADENVEMIDNNSSSTNDDDYYTSSNPLIECKGCRIKFETELEYERHMKTQHELSSFAQPVVVLNSLQKVPSNRNRRKEMASTEFLNKTQQDLSTSTQSHDLVNHLEKDLTNPKRKRKISASKQLTSIDSDNNLSSNDDDDDYLPNSKNVLTLDDSSTNNIKSSTGFLKISENLNLIIRRNSNWKADSDESPKKTKRVLSTRKCLYCEQTCTTNGYIVHLTTAHPEKKIGCSYCEKMYFRPKALLKHMKENHPSEKIDCSFCNFSTEIHGLYFEHMIEKHQEIFSERKCEFCDYTTVSAVCFGKHMTTEHDDKKPFKCDLCEKKFFTMVRKNSHQRGHAREGERSFCEICGRSYKYSRDLENHMDGHKNDKIIECNVCHKKFNRMDRYALHKRHHVNDKNYQCEECGNIFKHKTSLSRHIDVVHKNIKNHECGICEKKFSSSRELKCHKKRHAGMKDFKCEVCEKMFVRKSELKQHSVVHTGERRHVCEVCGRAFTQAHVLRGHLKTHNQ